MTMTIDTITKGKQVQFISGWGLNNPDEYTFTREEVPDSGKGCQIEGTCAHHSHSKYNIDYKLIPNGTLLLIGESPSWNGESQNLYKLIDGNDTQYVKIDYKQFFWAEAEIINEEEAEQIYVHIQKCIREEETFQEQSTKSKRAAVTQHRERTPRPQRLRR